MSIAALNWALRDPHVQDNVKGVARSVLTVLADHANQRQHEVWISRLTLVDETGFSDGACGKGLKELQAGGFILNLGYRERKRCWQLAVTSPKYGEINRSTMAPGANVTSAGAADVNRHDLSTTSARPQRELLTNQNPKQTTTTALAVAAGTHPARGHEK